MVTVAESGTRIFVSGTASGIDTAALIDAAVRQKTFRADSLQVQIDENTAQIGAYQQLDDLIGAVNASLSSLRGNPGLFDENETVFDLKAGAITTSSGVDYTSIADIAIDSSAENGLYQIEVTQAAQAMQALGTTVYADPDAALGYNSTFQIGLAGGPAPDVVVDGSMSLNQIAAAINANTDTSNVRASVIKTSESGFQIMVEALDTNRSFIVGNTAGMSALQAMGVTDGMGGFQDVLRAPQPASIEFDGVTVTRDDNNFDDLLTGVDIDIKNAAPGTIINLEVTDDTTSVKDAILNFVDAYNALRDFIVQNQQISESGQVAENAVLFGDALLSGVADTYSTVLAEQFSATGTLRTIRDLGITIGSQNKLAVTDEVALDNAILNNFADLRAAFQASGTSDNADFALLGSTSRFGSQNITFDITTDGAGTITNVAVGGDSSLFTINGDSIIGNEGTAYEGLRFSYVGAASATVNFNFNQGLADRLKNSLDPYVTGPQAFLVQERATLQTENTDKLDEIRDIRARAEAFRERQIERYADFEAKLQQLETLKSQIRAILGTDDDDN